MEGRYFDWAATGIPDSDILKESLDISIKSFGNPSSIHSAGRESKALLEDARSKVAFTMGVEPDQIFFTSGGTESNQLVLTSLIARPSRGEILVSSIEHPSLLFMARNMARAGFTIKEIPCDKGGFVTPRNVESLLTKDTQLVAVMAVNNETGAINDIKGIKKVIDSAQRKPHFHCDMVQALGKIPLDLTLVDSASYSSHKIGGARGSGTLFLKRPIETFLVGGGQERGARSGTENLFGAIAFEKCLSRHWVNKESPFYTKRVLATECFLDKLKEIKGVKIIREQGKNYSPYIVSAAFPKIPGEVLVRALSERGVFISTGSACRNNSSQAKGTRYVLDAMGVSREISKCAVRFSFGWTTTQEDEGALIEAIKEVLVELG